MTASDESIRALLIEDNPGDARLIREYLRGVGAGQVRVELDTADRLSSGVERIGQGDIELVLLDLSLPDSSGLETFDAVHAAAPRVPVVVVSGLDDEGVAVRAVHRGAQDYLVKGQLDGATILRSMRYAIERQRLEAARADLERQRDEFFSSVSHDLRTPVAAIKAAIGVVLANEPAGMPSSLHRLLGNIDLAADELASLIEDLLEIARLQAHRVELWRSHVDIREVVARAVRAVEPLNQARAQHMSVALPEEPVIMDVDGERLGRVLRNLLTNAQKYGADGGIIHVSVRELADGACISVRDDGPGMPLEEQAHIFERFYRGGRAKAPGTGLGLAIAKGLVELHGGELTVESSPGQGATFSARIPRFSALP